MTDRLYTVEVTNDHSGERVMVERTADCKEQAQFDACCQMFHTRGWRKTTAQPAVERGVAQA